VSLLEALPRSTAARLLSIAAPVQLAQKQVLWSPGAPIEWIYFPQTSVVSFLGVLSDGRAVEAVTVGREGIIGAPAALSVGVASLMVICVIAGDAWRVPVGAFRQAMEADSALSALLKRYEFARFTHLSRAVVCKTMHTVEAQCVTWLLLAHDRISGDEMSLTQQFLGTVRGIRRGTIVHLLGRLRAAGLIDYRYGRLTILDRAGLEAHACECYEAIASAYITTLVPQDDARSSGDAGSSGDAAFPRQRVEALAAGNRESSGDAEAVAAAFRQLQAESSAVRTALDRLLESGRTLADSAATTPRQPARQH
jgi:CRP-like cAMP-binding protein